MRRNNGIAMGICALLLLSALLFPFTLAAESEQRPISR